MTRTRTKVKDLKRKDCEGYYEWRHAQAEGDVKQKTVHGEQVTINGMMKLLYRQNETSIDGFDFKRLVEVNKNLKDIFDMPSKKIH